MKSRSQYGRERRSFAARMQEILRRKARSAQTRTYRLITPLLAEFKAEKNQLVFDVDNISKITQVRKIVDAALAEEGSQIARWIAGKVDQLININRKYFGSFMPAPQIGQVADIARNNTLLRLGYNAEANTIIKGGFLDAITTQTSVGQQVGAALNQSLGSRMGIKEFRTNFRDLFLKPDGLGLTEAHYYRTTFDIFQQYDRSVSKEYADQLELNYAVYSGTTMSNTRPFCSERVGKVFSREEIEAWKNETFQGKPTNYNPATDLGGYNCRHSLDWISDELAESFGRDVAADQNQTNE